MSFGTNVGSDFAQAMNYGQQIRFRYFNRAFPGGGSFYDDEVTLTQSGSDLYTSGLIQPLNLAFGSTDALLKAQGRLLEGDKRIYVLGDTNTSGLFRVGIGSPSTQEFSVIPEGIIPSPMINGNIIYKKLYVRFLPTGSLQGE